MPHPVYLTDQAYEDVNSTCNWWAENRSVEQSERWYHKFVATIDTLKSQPDRFSHAEENAKVPIDLKQANFGLGQKLTHRIVFTIRPEMVLVFRVLHLAQRELSVEDL